MTINNVASVLVGQKVIISGKFSDVDGVALRNSRVSVNVNGNVFTVKTDDNGVYALNYTTTKVGVNNLTVSYGGNVRYSATSTRATFNVLSRATYITINKIATVAFTDNVTIRGVFKNSLGVGLRNSRVAVKVNGVSTLVKTDDDGCFIFSCRASVVGVNNVTISYGGSSNYDGTSNSTKFNVVRKKVKLTINKINSVSVGKNVIISGKFMDIDGVALRNSQVTINVNGVIYIVKTDDNGFYTYTYKTNIVGTNNITASYGGNLRYGSNSTKLTFVVVK
jgi:hypothetical protein